MVHGQRVLHPFRDAPQRHVGVRTAWMPTQRLQNKRERPSHTNTAPAAAALLLTAELTVVGQCMVASRLCRSVLVGRGTDSSFLGVGRRVWWGRLSTGSNGPFCELADSLRN